MFVPSDVASILEHLPPVAAVARQRVVAKMNTGLNPKSKRDDKGCSVSAKQRIRQFPGQGLTVGLDRVTLICSFCSVDVARFKTAVVQHLNTERHFEKVKARDEAEKARTSGLLALKSWSLLNPTTDRAGVKLEGRFNGCTLGESTNAYRLEVTRSWIMGGNCLSRLYDEKTNIRALMEDGHYKLSLSSSQQLGPVIRQMERDRLKIALQTCKWVTIIFDGTTAVDEVFTILIRTVLDEPQPLTIKQWLCAVRWLRYSMDAKQQAAVLVQVLIQEYALDVNKIVMACADACAVNNAALVIMEHVCPNIVQIQCVSHGANLAGIKFETPSANSFINGWCTMIVTRYAV